MVTARKSRLDVKAKLTSKGQLTVPKEVRDYFGLKPGQELEFKEDQYGHIYIRRPLDPERFEKWRGHLKHLAGQDPDEMVREMRGD